MGVSVYYMLLLVWLVSKYLMKWELCVLHIAINVACVIKDLSVLITFGDVISICDPPGTMQQTTHQELILFLQHKQMNERGITAE